MARYALLKKTRTQIKLKVIGTGLVTIPLSEFALADETLVSPKVTINFVHWSLNQNTGVAVISRGSTPIQYLYGTDEWALAQESSISENEFPDQDITIDLQGGDGLVYLSMLKTGYQEPDTQAWDKTT